jgi:hypothetical protein
MEGKYRVRVFISDRSKQIRGGAELPTDLRKHLSLHCAGLTMELEVLNPAAEIVDALESGQRTEQTEDFGREIFGLALNIHNGIISYFRNIEKQSWVEPIAPDPRNWQSFLDGCETVWLDSKGRWRRFLVARTIEVCWLFLFGWGGSE